MIRLVVGPPGAGKSTLIQERSSPNDLVVELDKFRELAGDDEKARLMRGAVESKARDFAGDVWIARTFSSAADIDAFRERVGVDEVITLATDAELCKSRVAARDGNENLFSAIDRWFEEYDPPSAEPDKEIEDMAISSDKSEQVVDVDVKQDDVPAQESVDEFLERKLNEFGYPDDTPVSEMSDKEQAAYWKRQSRKHEAAAKRVADKTELSTAVTDPMLKRLFDAEFRAASAGVDADMSALKESLDISKFLDGKGGVDNEKLAKVIATVKPQKPTGAPTGAASRAGYESATGYEYGLALYDEMNKTTGGLNA